MPCLFLGHNGTVFEEVLINDKVPVLLSFGLVPFYKVPIDVTSPAAIDPEKGGLHLINIQENIESKKSSLLTLLEIYIQLHGR